MWECSWRCFILLIFLIELPSSSCYAKPKDIVPNIVHQIYDYNAPSLFLFLSISSAIVVHQPAKYFLWVNIEGKYRLNHWEHWIDKHDPKKISMSTDETFLFEWMRNAALIRNAFQEEHFDKTLAEKICSCALNSSIARKWFAECASFSASKIYESFNKVDFLSFKSILESERVWSAVFVQWILDAIIQVKYINFPLSPPGNDSVYATNKAHRSDFVRMSALNEYGGIYVDTDAYITHRLTDLLQFPFTMAFDNIVNSNKNAPKRLNNGVIFSVPNASFLHIWISKYANFDPNSWDKQSSVVPYEIATDYPDLIHLEMSRISPFSYGFQTAKAASVLTCGILWKNESMSAIWYPYFSRSSKAFLSDGMWDSYVAHALQQKLILHLTMSQARYLLLLPLSSFYLCYY